MEKTLQSSHPGSSKNSVVAFLLFAGSGLLAVLLGLPGGSTQADSDWYRALAQGQFDKVIQPFASRGLEPFLVRVIDHISNFNVDVTFAVLSSISLLTCFWALILLLPNTPSKLLWISGILFSPVWTTLFHAFLLPDIFHAALLSIFCVFLKKERYMESALMFVPMFAARESTVLILAIFLICLLGRAKFKIAMVAVTSSLLGIGLEKWLVLGTRGNRHNISQFAYLIGKLPFNLLKNVFGVQLWSNTILSSYRPSHVFHLPNWHIFGDISVIGLGKWEPFLPIGTVLLWLGTFGILPAVLLTATRGGFKSYPRLSIFLNFCILYGASAFLAGPALGASVYRLVAYGWPAFTCGLPQLRPNLFENRRILLVVHLAASWFAWFAYENRSHALVIIATLVTMSSWLFTIHKLRPAPQIPIDAALSLQARSGSLT